MKSNASCCAKCLFVLSFSVSTGAYSQTISKLDSAFNYNFLVLDSVANGFKSQRNISVGQNAFLYLIDRWVKSNSTFNPFDGGVRFSKKDVETWRNWYSRNRAKIDAADYNRAIEVYIIVFSKGLIEDNELRVAEKMGQKYRAMGQ